MNDKKLNKDDKCEDCMCEDKDMKDCKDCEDCKDCKDKEKGCC